MCTMGQQATATRCCVPAATRSMSADGAQSNARHASTEWSRSVDSSMTKSIEWSRSIDSSMTTGGSPIKPALGMRFAGRVIQNSDAWKIDLFAPPVVHHRCGRKIDSRRAERARVAPSTPWVVRRRAYAVRLAAMATRQRRSMCDNVALQVEHGR